MSNSSAQPKLTEGSIPRHLIRLAIPSSLGMIFNTLYHLSDFWFAGRISSDAIAGVSIAGSVFFLLIALGIGLQIGASAIVAPHVGANNPTEAKRWIHEIMGLAIVLGLLTMLLGWVSADYLIALLGAEQNVAPHALTYIRCILLVIPAFMLVFASAGILTAHGDTKSHRNALAVGFLVNIALNPIFIFVLEWGVTGIAVATGIVTVASMFYLHYKIGIATNSKPPSPAFNFRTWPMLLKQVIPASFNMLTIIIGSFITVALIGRFGSEHVAGFAIGLRLEQLLLLPALGMNSAVMAIAGQNLGAGNPERVQETYYSSLKIGLIMAAVSIPVMVFLSPQLMTFFTDNEDIIGTGAAYLRIDAVAFYAYVVLFIATATLQALKQPIFPMVLGIARHLVIPVSINVLLIVYLNFPMLSVFYTIIVVVVLSAIVAHLFTRWRLNKLLTQPTTS